MKQKIALAISSMVLCLFLSSCQFFPFFGSSEKAAVATHVESFMASFRKASFTGNEDWTKYTDAYTSHWLNRRFVYDNPEANIVFEAALGYMTQEIISIKRVRHDEKADGAWQCQISITSVDIAALIGDEADRTDAAMLVEQIEAGNAPLRTDDIELVVKRRGQETDDGYVIAPLDSLIEVCVLPYTSLEIAPTDCHIRRVAKQLVDAFNALDEDSISKMLDKKIDLATDICVMDPEVVDFYWGKKSVERNLLLLENVDWDRLSVIQKSRTEAELRVTVNMPDVIDTMGHVIMASSDQIARYLFLGYITQDGLASTIRTDEHFKVQFDQALRDGNFITVSQEWIIPVILKNGSWQIDHEKIQIENGDLSLDMGATADRIDVLDQQFAASWDEVVRRSGDVLVAMYEDGEINRADYLELVAAFGVDPIPLAPLIEYAVWVETSGRASARKVDNYPLDAPQIGFTVAFYNHEAWTDVELTILFLYRPFDASEELFEAIFSVPLHVDLRADNVFTRGVNAPDEGFDPGEYAFALLLSEDEILFFDSIELGRSDEDA